MSTTPVRGQLRKRTGQPRHARTHGETITCLIAVSSSARRLSTRGGSSAAVGSTPLRRRRAAVLWRRSRTVAGRLGHGDGSTTSRVYAAWVSEPINARSALGGVRGQVRGQLSPVADAELLEDVREVGLDGAAGDEEVLCDRPVAVPACSECGYP